jgi:hypothetical protein
VRAGEEVFFVRLPRRWREGWREDDRAPTALRVFVDGAAVPFTRQEPPRTRVPAAFFRGPRAGSLALRLQAPPADVVIVNETPYVKARVYLARLSRYFRAGATPRQ